MMVWVEDNAVFEFKTDKIGVNSNTAFDVYKVTSISANTQHPNENRFIINSKQLVSSGNNFSPKIIEADGGFLYVMKVNSLNNNFGVDTDYRVSINSVPIVADDYDNISIRGYSDDYEGDAVSLTTTQVHNFHDLGDKDWTIFWAENPGTVNIAINKIGHASD